MKKHSVTFVAAFLMGVQAVRAHCPLCTLGAAAAAGGASMLGVSHATIGVFLGAFAVSMGWWVARLIKRKIFKYQTLAIVTLSFTTTIIPLLSFFSDLRPVYVSVAGPYGSLLNRTYLFDWFMAGSIIGGLIVSIAPWLSKKITLARSNKIIPYQGILLTLAMLIAAGAIIQIST